MIIAALAKESKALQSSWGDPVSSFRELNVYFQRLVLPEINRQGNSMSIKTIFAAFAVAAVATTAAFAQTTVPQNPLRPATPAAPSVPAAPAAAQPAQVRSTVPANQLVNLNTATAAELDKLPQIGDARAKAIIAGRPYSSWDNFVSKNVIPKNAEEAINGKVKFR
jgi:competence protein ComEA